MTQTTNWAPVVYCRSRNVDYRFMALPEDALDAHSQEQILAGIRPMLGSVAGLRSLPAWAVFTTPTHCIFGTAAYVSDIADGPLEPDVTYVGVRQIYAFAGWAARLGGPLNVPSYEQLDISLARPLLATIQAHWEEQEYSKAVDSSQYSAALPASDNGPASQWTVVADGITISPVSLSHELWGAAVRALSEGRSREISLCIDLPYAHEARDSAYLHVTARDAPEVVVVRRTQPEPEPDAMHDGFDDARRQHVGDQHRSGATVRGGAILVAALIACGLAATQRWLLLCVALAGGALLAGRGRGHGRRAQPPATHFDEDDPLLARRRAARAEPRGQKSAWD